ncbi:MAG: LytR cpsA psr family, partial [Actinomycetota bacterium]
MSAIPARRRRRMIAAIVTSALSVVALPGGLVLGANSLLNDSGGNNVEADATAEIPSTFVELLAVTNSRNELASLALLSVTPEGKGGTIVSIPVGSATDAAAGEVAMRLGDAYAQGSVDALRFEVESLLNITVNVVEDVTSSELAVLINAIGMQPVTLPQPVIDTDAEGVATTVLKSGATTVSPVEIAAGLAASQANIAESTRLPQVKALWNAVARGGVSVAATNDTTSSVAQDADSSSLLAQLTTSQQFFTALFSGEVDVWQFGSTLLTDAQRNPNNLDLYSLDGGEVLMVMASVAPGALNLTSNNIAVMVDVPFNSTSFAREAVTRLAFLGANVVLVRQIADLPTERTTVYFNDPLAKSEGETFVDLLGPLEFQESADVISGVNLRIVLGNDFVAFLG